MAGRLIIGVIWVTAVLVTVLTAYVTRSHFADVNPVGGVFIVVGCAVVASVSVGLIRSPLVLGVTAIVAAVWASIVAWGVLHDESSTAALGVIAPPMFSAFVGLLGIGVSSLARTSRGASSRP
ncbi:MAG: hypothetical protein QOE62_2988 [Actinomycetota bacterium]|nr:hypothetical protein [Actinomycetota bacterium]